MISVLERSFPNIPDESYDDFFDSITLKVLDAITHINDFDYAK